MTTVHLGKGGSWLLEGTEPGAIFTPERLSEEHHLIARTAEEFTAKEVLPSIERLEEKDWDLARRLLRRAGDLGLLGPDAPEEYGGAGLDKTASLVVSQHISGSASFSAAFGAQANLAITPILLFGTTDQKRRYLPRLIAGEAVGAYALSESGSGSDALGAKARATRLADGSFALTGEKMWTTNGGFADIFIVFAKLDGDQFSAFIVERGFPGVSTGREERKMGLHGSSTTPLILQDARVPADNLLGEPGRGHKVAFNVLNFGRFKLGAMCVGGAMIAIAEAARYAASRRQFGQPIATFGAIKHKLGEMSVRTYAVESLLYRTSGLIDGATTAADGLPSQLEPSQVLAAMEEFAVEASIAKVAGSETLEYVLDENVQIHGGNGFVKDYPAERHYRDARVNRIFEGTNEINRLLIPGMLLRRAVRGDLPLIPAARKLHDEMLSGSSHSPDAGEGPLEAELRAVAGFKKVALMMLGLGLERFGEQISEQQEILLSIADVVIAVYGAESAALRAIDAVHGTPTATLQIDAARVCVNDATSRVEFAARHALAAMADGDALRIPLTALRRFLKTTPIDTVAPRRRLADETVSRGRYLFQ